MILSFLAAALVLALAAKNNELWLAILAATLLGMYCGRWGTMAYRRGTILRLERELSGYREFDEEDEG